MLSSTEIIVTEHALIRYRQRIGDNHSTYDDVKNNVQCSNSAGQKTMRKIRESCFKNRYKVNRDMYFTNYIYQVDRFNNVFVLQVIMAGEMRLLTCWKI